MNENNKQAPTLQVLDSGGRYASSFVQMDDAVARFGQVVPNSPVAAMENLNRLTPGQSQGQCWPPYPYTHDPNNRPVSGYDHYRPYPGFAGQFSDSPDQYSGNHSGFSMRYQEVTSKPEHVMSGNHLLCLDDGLGYPISETRAASLPPFSSITTQSLPPRPQSAVKEDLRGYEEGLGARLTGSGTPSHNEFGEGLSARLLERGMGVHSREDNYTPPVQYRPWEVNPGPVRVSSRSQSETSQTPPSSASGYPEKREDEGDSRSSWYRAKSESSSFSKEPNLVSLDKPSDHNSGTQKGGSTLTPVENQSESSNTYSPLTKHGHPYQHGREESPDMGRLPFPSNSFGYFPGSLPPPLLGSGVGPPWDYRNDIPLKSPAGDGAIDPASKYPLVPPPVRPGEMQNIQHQYIDDRQLRGGRQHGASSYCQNGSDNYKYPPISEAQSPGMQPTPPNAQNYSGSGNMHMKPEHEPGLKGGDKLGSHASSTTPTANLKSGEMGRGTKNAASASDDSNEKKPKKQKRKRCGECLGCQRKDNCGDCAPCRNEKSHQICKMRRCEKLIERKCSSTIIVLKEQSSVNDKISAEMNQPFIINSSEDISQLMEFSKEGFWNNEFYGENRCEIVPSSEHEFERFDAENEVRTYTDLEPVDKGLNKHQLTNDKLKKKLQQRQDAKAAKNTQESNQIKTSPSSCRNSNQDSGENILTLPSYSSLENNFNFSLNKNEIHEYHPSSNTFSSVEKPPPNPLLDFSLISYHQQEQLPKTQPNTDYSLIKNECKDHLKNSSLLTLPNSNEKLHNSSSPHHQEKSVCHSQNLHYSREIIPPALQEKSNDSVRSGEIKTVHDVIENKETVTKITSVSYNTKESNHHFHPDKVQKIQILSHNLDSNLSVYPSVSVNTNSVAPEQSHILNSSCTSQNTSQSKLQFERQKFNTSSVTSTEKLVYQDSKMSISHPSTSQKIFQNNSHLNNFNIESFDSYPPYNKNSEIITTSQNAIIYSTSSVNNSISSTVNVQCQSNQKDSLPKTYFHTKSLDSLQKNNNWVNSKLQMSLENGHSQYNVMTESSAALLHSSLTPTVKSSEKSSKLSLNCNHSNEIICHSSQSQSYTTSLSSSLALTTITATLPNSPIPSSLSSIPSSPIKKTTSILESVNHYKTNYRNPITLPSIPSMTSQPEKNVLAMSNDKHAKINKNSNQQLPPESDHEELNFYLKNITANEGAYFEENKHPEINVALSTASSNHTSSTTSHNNIRSTSSTHSHSSTITDNKGKDHDNNSSRFHAFDNELPTRQILQVSLPDTKHRLPDPLLFNGISQFVHESNLPKTTYFDSLKQGLVYSTATRTSSKLFICKSQTSNGGKSPDSASKNAPLMSSTPFILHPKKTPDSSSTSVNSDLKTHSTETPGSQNTTENVNNCHWLERLERLRTNTKIEAPSCDCLPKDDMVYQERTPYYTHLGYGPTLSAVREIMEKRFEVKGEAIRIEKLRYTGKEGKTSQGCPIAKWIIRRANAIEKYLVLIKHRFGHHCATAWIVVAIVAWEGVASEAADDLYETLVYKLTNFGLPTQRRCGINEQRTCACQGMDNQSGASFSFGCSWSMYYNGCKFARSKNIRKFKLGETSEEAEVEEKLQNLATNLAPVYKQIAPESFSNQVEFEELGKECRLGKKVGRPWSGVTACVDFCAHAHKDLHNMNNGCTVVVTLTKHRGLEKPDDEQLHVLPLYIMEDTDEYDSKENQMKKIQNGSLEVLRSYPMEMRFRKNPLSPCRKRGKKRKDDANVTPKKRQNTVNSFYNRSPGYESVDKFSQGSKRANTMGMRFHKAAESPGKKSGNNFKHPLFVPPNQLKNFGSKSNPGINMDTKTFNECLRKTFEELKVKKLINSKFRVLMEESLQSLSQSIPTNDKCYEENMEMGVISHKSINHKINKKSLKVFNQIPSFEETQNFNLTKSQQLPSKLLPHPDNVFPSALHLLSEAVSMKCQELADSPINHPKHSFNKHNVTNSDISSSHNEYQYQAADLTSAKISSTIQQPTKWMSNSVHCSNGSLPASNLTGTDVQASNVLFNQAFQKVNTPNLSETPLNICNFSPASLPIQAANNESTDITFNKESLMMKNSPSSYNLAKKIHYQKHEQFFPSNFSSHRALPKNSNANPMKLNIGLFQNSANDPITHIREGEVANIQPPNQDKQQLPPFSNFFQQPYTSCQNVSSTRNSFYPLQMNSLQNFQQSQDSQAKMSSSLTPNNLSLPSLGEIHVSQVSHSMGKSTENQIIYPKDCNISKYNPKSGFLPQCMPFMKANNQQWSPVIRPNISYTKEERLESEIEYTTPPPSPPTTDEEKDPNGYFEVHSDNEENFNDNTIGGVAIALSHRSVLFECAKHELHATTALKKPNRLQPTRISLVFYQHKNLNLRYHGWCEWEKKMEMKRLEETGYHEGSSPRKKPKQGSTIVNIQVPTRQTITSATTSWITVFPFPPVVVTGPYQKWI